MTVILEDEGQAYQHILTADSWSLTIAEDAPFKGKAATEKLSSYIAELTSKRFDLARDFMLGADLIRLEDQEHILVIMDATISPPTGGQDRS